MLLLIIFILGLLVGSFLNVVIYRLPRGENLALPSSHCPHCGTPLKPWELIPLAGFLLLAGKCSTCSRKISLRYPLVEVINALVWTGLIYFYGLTPLGLSAIFLFSLGLVVTFIDIEHHIIPDALVVVLLAGGILYHFLVPELSLLNRLLGAGTGFGLLLFLRIVSRGGMGGGDIKLMGALGFWLGLPQVLFALFLASFFGSLIGLFLVATGLRKRKEPIPFGPFLIMGFLIIQLFQDIIFYWYWNLFSGMV